MALNPLSSSPSLKPAPQHPMLHHAKVWAHVGKMAPEDVQSKTTELDAVVPLLGALAGKPNVSRKDVIRAAADASGAGHIDPSQAVAFISQMPDDPKDLQPWLRNAYTTNLTALVHLKAAQMASNGVPAAGAPNPAAQQQGAPAMPAAAPTGMPE
jgi:hypothetical protein